MNFIKKIKEKRVDENVHLQFQRFSKGEFRNRAVLKVKFSKGKYTINTSAEFGNELVEEVASIVGPDKVRITGAIVSTVNLKELPEYKDVLQSAEVKQFQGVKRFILDLEITGNEIVKMVATFPKAFFGLSFSTTDGKTVLKIKPKAPKSGKPGTKGEDTPKPDFCKLVTTNSELGKSFIFENTDFKEAEANHVFFIDDIIISDELKKSGDYSRMRKDAIKKGRIIRKTKIDGRESESTIAFEA